MTRQPNPEHLAELRRILEDELPFNVHLGLRVETLEPGHAVLRLPFRPEFVGDTRRPALHGGVISMLVDTCGGTAVWASCGLNDRVATIDMRVDYLRPAPEDDLIATATVSLMGNRVGNSHVLVHSASDMEHAVAEGRGVYNIRRQRN